MSSHDSHDNHSNEPKAISFTVPFILASVTLVLIFMFLSLCDPKKHGCECKENCSKECMEACERGDHSLMKGAHGEEGHGGEANKHHVEVKDTMAVETPVPTATDTAHVAKPEHH